MRVDLPAWRSGSTTHQARSPGNGGDACAAAARGWGANPWRQATGLRSIRLLVVDCCPVVQEGVQLFARTTDRIRIIATAGCGQDAIDAAVRVRPDAALIDARLPDMLLAEAVRRIRTVSPATKLIVFAAPVTPALLDEAARLGLQGVLGKDATRERFRDAVERVMAGELVSDPPGDQLLRRAAAKLNGTPLTPREHEILRRAAMGESNEEIAKVIFLSPTTVKSYLQSALRKLNARNRVQAVVTLGELGLL
jgi:two-component system, NarL family, nitrate/nitrite response regulator NarL